MLRFVAVHIGDTHGRLDGRSDDQLRALDDIINIGLDLCHHSILVAWLWPGDLFHTVSDPQTRNALFQRVMRMADVAPIVIVRGNHDLPGELDAFAWLRGRHQIHVSLSPEVLTLGPGVVPFPYLVMVATMPYPNAAALVAAGTPPADIAQVARTVLDGLVMNAAAQLADAGPMTIPIFAGHATIAGAVSSVGQPQIGNDVELDRASLARLPVNCYVAMNHIHKHQEVGRAVYAGSIVRMDFGEMEPKGCVIAEWHADDETHAVRFAGWIFKPIDVPRMYHIEGELTPLGFTYRVVREGAVSQGTADLLALTELGREALDTGALQPPPVSFKGADVRVRYTYKRGEVAALNVAYIHAEFAEARTLKIEAVPIQEHEIRNPAVVAAPTLLDKLREYAETRGIPWSDSLREKAARLEVDPCEVWQREAVSRIGQIGADVLPEDK